MGITLSEHEDFYYNEEGLMVLTAAYLKKRGFCCKNGCLHCPFGYGRAGLEADMKKRHQPSDEPDKTM